MAIHFTTDRGKFEWNNENHLKAVLGTISNGKLAKGDSVKEISSIEKVLLIKLIKKLGPRLSEAMSKKLNIHKENIIDYDLCLYDTNKACLSGIEEEFITSGRIDNLGSSFTSLQALINHASERKLDNSSSINCIALFDNEEIGSRSYQGCDSVFFADTLRRIFNNIVNEEKVPSKKYS